MLRSLFLVLLLVNGVLFAAYKGLFNTGSDREREPERLQRQHQPALVQVLNPRAVEAAMAAASAARAASAAQAAPSCVETGPLPPAEATTAERALRDLGLAPAAWQALRHESGGTWMVYMGRYADREVLQRKLAELRRRKVDGKEVADNPALQPGINLGRFDDVQAARAALAHMAQQGVRTARVITLREPQTVTVLRLPAADGALRTRLAALPLPAGRGFVACKVQGAAAAASASGPAPVAAAGASAASAAAPASAPAAPASQSRIASADTRAALERAAAAEAAEAASAKVKAALPIRPAASR
jgi:hypothetical protein